MDYTNNSITIYEYQTLLGRLEKAEDQVINLRAQLIEAKKLLEEQRGINAISNSEANS